MAHIPQVSVCMASYNHAAFLPAALDSILGQTFRDFEVVVVDDGSTDKSLDVVQSYARKYPEIVRILSHPCGKNLGISATGNLLTKEARGRYWCPHASDDVSYPDRLERHVAFLESHPEAGWVYGIADFIDKDGARLEGELGCDLSAFPDLVEELILGNRIAGGATMVRMECLRAVGPFEPGLMYSDWEFWIRLAARYAGAFLPGAVGGYRCHDYNTSMSFSDTPDPGRRRQNFRYSLDVITTLRQKADEQGNQLSQPRKKALLDLTRTAFLLFLNDKQAASRAAAAVFRSDPSLRYDLKHLAHCLATFESRRLAFTVIRALGFPPRWVTDTAFMSMLLRLGADRR